MGEITKARWMNRFNSYIRKSEVHTFVVTKNPQRNSVNWLLSSNILGQIFPSITQRSHSLIFNGKGPDLEVLEKNSYLEYSGYKQHQMSSRQAPIVQNYSNSWFADWNSNLSSNSWALLLWKIMELMIFKRKSWLKCLVFSP